MVASGTNQVVPRLVFVEIVRIKIIILRTLKILILNTTCVIVYLYNGVDGTKLIIPVFIYESEMIRFAEIS